jgi:hypothetical protein
MIRFRVALAALGAAMLLGVAACSPGQLTPAPTIASSAAVDSPSESVPSAAATTPSASTRGTPRSLPPGVTVDPGLLEVLPTEIDGVPLEPDPVTAAEVGSDPLLADSVLSLAVAVAVAPGDQASSPANDLAVASVIRLRPDVFDEAFYQEWRDTYDDAACEVADGVESQDQTEIDGRQVYLGTCLGGARTYHTYLVDQGFIVSVTATGEQLFGERIMAGLAG